ncbi:MAG: YebC/PmpR family DNA-binding transcriptional regulator [Syntrophobacterales bacterium]|jgi:YebC/PmpR family DNA-binding regulatory protein|nr:YebC/PmpR family DNA-binding transcriptional regulator [Syntrophobacterales bacterium]
MSGHSKWSSIKHKKGAADAKRGKIFTKLIREITTAARIGGGDPEANSRLRVAIAQAKSENMPKDNIEKAVKKGTSVGEGGENYEEQVYEGYGPGGTAVLVATLTDNKKRTTAEVRHIFSRLNGNLAEPGAVAWQFQKKGLITFEKNTVDEDRLMELALEAGAEDISDAGDDMEVYTSLADFEKVKKVFDDSALKYIAAEVAMVPQATVKLEGKHAETMLKLMEALEDLDDVQNVYANFDISLEELARLS